MQLLLIELQHEIGGLHVSGFFYLLKGYKIYPSAFDYILKLLSGWNSVKGQGQNYDFFPYGKSNVRPKI